MIALKKAQQLSVRLLETIAGIGLISMVAVVLIGVLDRFLLHLGLPWPEELARFQLIWLSFLSASLAVTTQAHYVVDVFYKKIFPRVSHQLIIEASCRLLSMLIALILLFQAGRLVKRVSWQLAPALELSMSWVYISIPIGLFFVAFFYLVDLLDALFQAKSGENAALAE